MSSKSNKQPKHHTESSHSHDPRKEHDRKARAHNEDVYGTGGVSNNVRLAMIAIAAIIIGTLTIAFMAGLINW